MNLESEIYQVNINDIIPNRFQPRLTFDEAALNELASSIKEHGIIQPLVLRKLGDKYEIIAGERRYKASIIAGLTTVPAIISNMDDNKSAEIAIVENVQRKDLTAIEEARSYKKLLDKGYLTQEQLAEKMGVSQSSVANKLRLLNLDEKVQDALLNGKISERHARSLLSLKEKEEQVKMLDRILNERLTVRQLDSEIKKLLPDSEEDSEDIPIIDPIPSIDEIKNKAVDINPQETKPKLSLEELLKPQTTETQEKEQTNEKPLIEPSKNKFFNFLEDEEVNMNVTEETPSLSPFNQPLSIPKTESNDSDVEVLDINPTNITSIEEAPSPTEDNIFDIPNIFDNPSASTKEEPVEQLFISQSPTPTNNNIFDPISIIDKVAQQKEEEKNQKTIELKDAINDIRNLTSSLEQKGFVINLEELDLDKSYQINIKIDK